MNSRHLFVHNNDLYEVSGKGVDELREVGTTLSVQELQILVLINGQTTVASIAKRLALPIEPVRATFADLLRRGLILPASERALAGVDDFFSVPLAKGDTGGETIQAGEQFAAGLAELKSSGYHVAITRRIAGAPKPGAGKNHTVLVVDDDPSMPRLLQYYLEREGFVVRLATNREEIVAALRRRPVPDLALLDIRLPDADGFEVLARIRMHPILKEMPVVMMTALAARESVLTGLQLGADGYLTKPFKREVLLRVVDAVLGVHKSG